MSTHSLKLWFAGGDVTKDELPGAVAYIAVQHATCHEYERFISHQCSGPVELTAEVKRLKRELDQILNLGARRFAQYEERTREAIRRKHEKRGH